MPEQQFLQFAIAIAGAAALLLWAVRLVRTGVERAFSHQLRLWLRRSSGNRILAASSGAGAALLLQSSTAVAILVANFASTGTVTTGAGLAMLLGADVGSAMVIQFLLQRQEIMIPALLLLGVVLFLKTPTARARQIGRILIGLALVFVSLDMIRAAAVPLAGSPGLLAAMQYLGQDAISAFIVGALFAWAMHSSVAVVLLIFTFVAQGLLPVSAAVAIVLGANLGGAFIAYVLTMKAPYKVRRIIAANLVLRGGGAALLLVALALFDYPLAWLGQTDAGRVVNLHLAFNIALAFLALPMLGSIQRIIETGFPERQDQSALLVISSALDEAALEKPEQALACSSREILAIGQRVETMLRAIDSLYTAWDDPLAKAIEERDREIRKMHFDLKLYLARLHRQVLDDEESRESMDHAALAANLEAASTMIARNMVMLARRLQRGNKAFSIKGRDEIADFHDRVLSNVQLGLNVMMTQNPDAARELIVAKDEVRDIEQQLQRHHLGRLREGLVESIETSNIHQETLRALKQVNTSFSMIAYPILSKSGDLLASRLASDDVVEDAG